MGKNICKADQLRNVDPTLSTYLAQAGVSMESVRDLETHKTSTKGINIVTFLGNISANKTRLLTVCQCDYCVTGWMMTGGGQPTLSC